MKSVENSKFPLSIQEIEAKRAIRQKENGMIDDLEKSKNGRLITRLQFIEYFQITSKCEWNWRMAGLLPFVKIGAKVYYDFSDVINFKERHKQTKK